MMISHRRQKKPSLSAKQKSNLSQELTDGTIFSLTSKSGPTSMLYEVTKGNSLGTIQNLMSKYKKYDLSGVKMTINITVGAANKNEIVPPGHGYALYRQAVKELVKAGFSKDNIQPGVVNRDPNQYSPTATFILK